MILCDNLEGQDGVGVVGRFKREGAYVYSMADSQGSVAKVNTILY